MAIELKEDGSKGAAEWMSAGKPLAKMTYSRASDELIIIDHTEVDESLQGQGIGLQLLEALVDLARKERFKVMPLCPFAKAMFKKHEALRDVLK